MVTGSNPVSGATSHKPPKIGTFSHNLASNLQIYATNSYNNATKYLYKVNNTYYFKKRYGTKTVRISLRTKNYAKAVKRRKLLLLLGAEVFKYRRADLEIFFEYETNEELINTIKALNLGDSAPRKQQVLEHINTIQQNIKDNIITFEEIETAYLLHKKTDKNVSKNSLYAYTTTFNLLKQYFKDVDVKRLKISNFMAFKQYLIKDYKPKNGKNISNTSINKHLIYLKNFIKYAYSIELIDRDITAGLPLLAKQQAEKVENYTNEEINNIINYNNYKSKKFNLVFKILAYTGMRSGELYGIEKDDIINENGVYCFNIKAAKTQAGIRKVPIHTNILKDVLSADFPIFNEYTKGAYEKALRIALQQSLGNKYRKVHTIRGTVIQNMLYNNKNVENSLLMVQSIVGHSLADRASLTVNTYAGGFNIKLLQNIVNSINY